MKTPKSKFSILLLLLFFICSCASGPKFDKSKFETLYAAARAVQTSITAGESYQQVNEKEQQFAAAIGALKDKVQTQKEKELLDAYSDLLSTYRDGLVLWKYKLDFAFFDSVLKGRIYVGQDADPIVIKYRFPTKSHLYEPTGQYWKSISGDSIQIIWSNVDSQMKAIANITNY